MSQHEPEATPAQQEAVRRLLAEARHDEPVPPEVAARLDAVLAGLAAEGPRAVDASPAGAGQVADLAARRRRRATGFLVAAAAVVVVGVGAGQLVGSSGGDESTATSSGDAGDSSVGGAEAEQESAGEAAAPGATALPSAPAQDDPDELDRGSRVPALNGRTFARAVLVIRRTVAATPSTGSTLLGDAQLTSSPMFVCPPAAWGEGDLVAVRFAGRPAVLAYRPPVGDTQTVDLLQCGSGTVLRSTTLPY